MFFPRDLLLPVFFRCCCSKVGFLFVLTSLNVCVLLHYCRGRLFGLNPKASSAAFSSVPLSLAYAASERPALNLLANRTASPLSDLDALTASLTDVQTQLRRVLSYVQSVVKGDQPGDPVVGRFILDSIAKVPVGSAYSTSTEEGDQPTSTTQLEALFNSHLQDVLMVSYLANLVRGQAEISSRMALLA